MEALLLLSLLLPQSTLGDPDLFSVAKKRKCFTSSHDFQQDGLRGSFSGISDDEWEQLEANGQRKKVPRLTIESCLDPTLSLILRTSLVNSTETCPALIWKRTNRVGVAMASGRTSLMIPALTPTWPSASAILNSSHMLVSLASLMLEKLSKFSKVAVQCGSMEILQ